MFAAACLLFAAAQEPIPWERFVREVYDPAWSLPEPTARELVVDGREVVHLAAAMREWVRRDFALAPGAEPAAGHEPVLLGDLVRELRPLARDRKRFRARIEELSAKLPGLDRRSVEWLGQLLRDDALRGEDWDPGDDEPNDGLLLLPPWELDPEVPGRHRYWRERGGNGYVYQLAAFYFADAWSIATTDCDLAAYQTHANNEYEDIHAVPGSLVRSTDPAGRPVASYRVFYTWDLDFPYSTYDCELDVFIHVDDHGDLVTETRSDSEDVYWTASRDLFLPVRDHAGEWVCFLLVQEFGIDIDGVPDRESDRLEGIRGLVGSKKKLCEALFAGRRGEPHNPSDPGELIADFPFPGGEG